jgi:protease-4
MGSPFRAMTPEERAIFQSVIDDLYRQFVVKVMERRKLPETTARALGDGRIYTADQALQHRLIDRVGYMPDAIDLARQEAGVDKARVVIYHRPRQYRATYYAEAQPTEGGLMSGALGMFAGPGPRFLYLWMP